MVGSSGLEPPTSRLSGVRSNHLSYEPMFVAGSFPIGQTCGGDEQNRTVDPLLARQVLSQLSYTPTFVDTAIGQENKQRERSQTTIREFLTLDVLFSQRLSIERR